MNISVTDMHTGGEPVRIVTDGWPEPDGATILEKRAFAQTHQDHLRRFIMFEPRGHADMYGALIVTSRLPGADFGVLFMHNEGWSTMCGHAVIALGRYAVDQGWVAVTRPTTRIGIECPCGLVVAEVEIAEENAGAGETSHGETGKLAGAVSFASVPAFLFAADQRVDVPGFGEVVCDVAYGGAFYALADAAQFGLAFGRDPVRRFVDAADALTQAVKGAVRLSHPESADLAFLYGSILTDGAAAPTRNICVFAEREVDRSPTGSGVTARLAAMHAKGTLDIGEKRVFESITGARFDGSVVAAVVPYPVAAIRARVGGKAHYSGKSRFMLEPDDILGRGFLVR
jgi:proline racemase